MALEASQSFDSDYCYLSIVLTKVLSGQLIAHTNLILLTRLVE